MANMAKSINMEGKVSNHSARKTMADRLISKGVDTKFVKDLGGWKSISSLGKNINSLESNNAASVEQQHLVSSLLQANGSSSLNQSIPFWSDFHEINKTEDEVCITGSDRTVIPIADLDLDAEGKLFQFYKCKYLNFNRK